MASENLKPGMAAEIETVVDEKLVVKHVGGDGVLSTPSMIGLMERAGIQAVQAHLPEGHTTVGFEVNVKHFGATPKGKKVKVRAELLEIDGKKLSFKVEAHDEDKQVGAWNALACHHCGEEIIGCGTWRLLLRHPENATSKQHHTSELCRLLCAYCRTLHRS